MTHTQDKERRSAVLQKAICRYAAEKDTEFETDLGEFLLALYGKDTEERLHYDEGAFTALMGHFANRKNLEQLPTWLHDIGERLYQWYLFVQALQGSEEEFTVFLDYWRAVYYGDSSDEGLAALESKYSINHNL